MNKKSKKVKIFKWVISLLVIGMIIGSIAYLFPIIKNIATPEGKLLFKEKITNTGITGLFILFSLEIAQIFLVILPGEPLEVLAGMCYGSFWGTVFLLVSVFITTTIIFYLIRKFGKKFIYEFFSEEKVEKIEKSKLLNNPKKIDMLLVLLFFIPGTPKDLLVYVGGLLPIKPWKFIAISTFARFPSIISSTLAGNNLIQGNWTSFFIIYFITFIFVIGIFLLINLLDKNQETKKAHEEIK